MHPNALSFSSRKCVRSECLASVPCFLSQPPPKRTRSCLRSRTQPSCYHSHLTLITCKQQTGKFVETQQFGRAHKHSSLNSSRPCQMPFAIDQPLTQRNELDQSMPVTIEPSPKMVGTNCDATAASERDLFEKLVAAWEKEVDFDPYPMFTPPWKERKPNQPIAESRSGKSILHSSFNNMKSTTDSSIIPYGNGFVDGIIRAFQQDLHLALRPDDVWLAILTQFSFYIDKHAEKLRSKFVKHQGKAELVLANTAAFKDADVGAMAGEFTTMMKDHMADDTVHEWLTPAFSTTTDTDKAVSSMVMMATVNQYFNYVMMIGCGFPSVTLHGEPSDWQTILRRLAKFAEFGEEPAAWAELLKPVVKRFIATFYLPDSAELKDFWMNAIHSNGQFGSASSPTFSGWLTAFMFWEKEGERCPEDTKLKGLVLDGVKYPVIWQNRRGVPTGVVEVPVVVEAYDLGVKLDTRIVAGSMGVTVTKLKGGERGEVVQPCSGWWMLEYGREVL